MTGTWWKALALVLAPVALVVAACGVDSGDQATETTAKATTTAAESSTTEPDSTKPSLSDADQEMVDIVVDTYVELGFTEEEATCLAEGLVGTMSDPTDTTDMNGIMDVVNDCDIDPARLGEIGEGLGGGSMEDGMKAGMEASFRNMGLTDDEASCLADAYIDEYGTDVGPAQDSDKLLPLLDACGLQPSDLGG